MFTDTEFYEAVYLHGPLRFEASAVQFNISARITGFSRCNCLIPIMLIL
jgi:hypothetical protein